MPKRVVCAFLLWRAAAAFRPGNPPRPRAATARRAEAAPGPAPPLGGGRGVPLGPPAAASEPGYERWISSQLRTNRIQDATRGLKDKVVDALRRPDAEAELATIGRDLNLLVTSGNTGVTERARSTLLTQQRAWEELLPVRAAFPRYARFVAAKDDAGAAPRTRSALAESELSSKALFASTKACSVAEASTFC